MPGDVLSLTGGFIGVVGLAWATFTGVSYFEVRKKIDEAVEAGKDPYELQSRAYEIASKRSSRVKPTKKALKPQGKAKKARSKRK
ncbi:hypothetical protein ABBQ38_002672 [Trebouxia sp. C0009 RCD-2024]